MAKVELYSKDKGRAVDTSNIFEPFVPLSDTNELALEVIDATKVHGTFKSVTRTSAGTSEIAAPTTNGSLLVTDILISGEKQTGSTAEIRFTDDTDTVALFLASQVDAPPNLGISFNGRVQGWKGARLDLITSGAGDATVLVCYTKIPNGIPYAEWDAYR